MGICSFQKARLIFDSFPPLRTTTSGAASGGVGSRGVEVKRVDLHTSRARIYTSTRRAELWAWMYARLVVGQSYGSRPVATILENNLLAVNKRPVHPIVIFPLRLPVYGSKDPDISKPTPISILEHNCNSHISYCSDSQPTHRN